MSAQRMKKTISQTKCTNQEVLIPNTLNSSQEDYQQEIKEFCQRLSSLNLEDFSMQIQFNNGDVFSLSSKESLKGTLDQRDAEITEDFNNEATFHTHRCSPECAFVFAATWTSDAKVDALLKKGWGNQFDDFCVAFVEKFKPIILSHHANYKNSYVFNSETHLAEVIKNKRFIHRPLTTREKQCLLAAMDGLSTKETARKLGISYTTVRGYLEEVRGKLHSSTIAEAVGKALYHGKIGCIFSNNLVSDEQ